MKCKIAIGMYGTAALLEHEGMNGPSYEGLNGLIEDSIKEVGLQEMIAPGQNMNLSPGIYECEYYLDHNDEYWMDRFRGFRLIKEMNG